MGRTDSIIQKTLRRNFRDCTVLTVAHRLFTVIDSDLLIVMESGQIIEYGPPYLLVLQAMGNASEVA
ncbi:unnamed protein product [Protopolystoma xenopodis]|uniref:ABC transporter domain-containing protein n=1 Tax=Protopolystoma xenopodis TaxID=117903 RepID=A0A3S5ALC5_9PLAT|nr:unnamed protein product [Protopolystoma xenopodis]